MQASSGDATGHRRGSTVLRVIDEQGVPVADAEVVVVQERHEFAFGNIGFDFIPLAAAEAGIEDVAGALGAGDDPADLPYLRSLAGLWLDLFDTATLPFYWGDFEPVQGSPRTAPLQATARWFADRGVRLKGHPLVWHTVTAPWLLELSVEEVERVQRDRVRRDVGDFAGLIDTWDAINEVVIMPVFDRQENGITRLAQKLGRVPMVRLAFEEARAANPSATLLLNDFDLSADYERLIEEVLAAGIRIDALGLQTHMHQGYWGEEKMLAMVDRFARFGLPLHLTESTLLSGAIMPPEIEDLNDYQVEHWPSTPEGEERQAQEIERHYRSLVSHASVEAITYWGLGDRGAWLGAPVGLVRPDGTPKPSYDALHSLIRGEWWLPETRLRTDADGRVPVSGFRGDYSAQTSGETTAFSLGADAGETVIRTRG